MKAAVAISTVLFAISVAFAAFNAVQRPRAELVTPTSSTTKATTKPVEPRLGVCVLTTYSKTGSWTTVYRAFGHGQTVSCGEGQFVDAVPMPYR